MQRPKTNKQKNQKTPHQKTQKNPHILFVAKQGEWTGSCGRTEFYGTLYL